MPFPWESGKLEIPGKTAKQPCLCDHSMLKRQKILAVIILVLIIASAYGYWVSRETDRLRQEKAARKTSRQGQTLVDQTPLKTAQQLAQLAATRGERELAKEALRLADYEVDLTFDSALHDALLHPPPLSAEAKQIQDRLKKADKLLEADQNKAKQLSEELVKAPESKQEALQIELVQAQADMELDQDERDDAKEDFARAGGNLAGKIQALKKEHEETTHSSESAIRTTEPPPEKVGLIHRVQQWLALRSEKRQIQAAKDLSDAAAVQLAEQHNALDARIEEETQKSPDLLKHSTKRKEAPAGNPSQATNRTPEQAAALLEKTEQISADQKTLAALDKRVETHKELSGVYAQWLQLLTDRQWAVFHRATIGVLLVLAIALLGLPDKWVRLSGLRRPA